MIRIRPNSVLLATQQQPGMAASDCPPGTNKLHFRITPIQVTGELTLEDTGGGPGSRPLDLGASVQTGARTRIHQAPATSGTEAVAPRGWELGWIQLQLSEVNWAYYEGRDPKAGSVLMRFDREPARKPGICRDTSTEGLIWYRGAFDEDKDVSVFELSGRETLPVRMVAVLGDAPEGEFEIEVRNRTTNTINQLVECELHLRFCAVLALRKPGSGYDFTYQFLKHFEWSVGGRYKVMPPAAAGGAWDARLLGKHHCAVSKPIDGPPAQPEQVKMLTDIRAPHCLSLAKLAPQRARPEESATRTGPPRHG